MRSQKNQIPTALKHGGYASTSVLPGENKTDFDKLHQDLIAEYAPNGVSEDDIVETMARLLWRKKNLRTFRIAERAANLRDRIRTEIVPGFRYHMPEPKVKIDPDEQEAALKVADDAVRKEFGESYGLLQIGDVATVHSLENELDLQDRLDATIDRCVKRLLLVRGLKSISSASSSAPPRQLPGPSKAA